MWSARAAIPFLLMLFVFGAARAAPAAAGCAVPGGFAENPIVYFAMTDRC